ncbi:hypothetical protein ABN214_15165 [Proteus terrae]|uniref:hypothetical protein n=1 Tax=Proteus terrae TaxID=1574161 RepID=UPI0032D9F195
MNEIAKALGNLSGTTPVKPSIFNEPIYPQPNDMWRIWHIKYIYKGKEFMKPDSPDGVGCWVPKIGDFVVDPAQGWFIVTDVDIEGDLHSKLKPWSPIATDGGDEDGDFSLLGGHVGNYTSEQLICSVDYSQMPAVMVVDNRLQVYGTNVATAKVFLNNDIGPNGEVISCRFDNSGNIISENMELELIDVPGVNNRAIWIPKPCHTNKRLPDGETATLVFYDKEGGYIPPAHRMVIQNSAFIRQAEAPKRYVKRVELLTPFRSENDPNLIELSVDISSIASVEWVGRVWYTDNTYRDLRVDGTKFILNGSKGYIPTTAGQSASLMLTYVLGEGEAAIQTHPGEQPHVYEHYRVRTTAGNGSYAPKLYGYPVWTNGRWEMKWWLYNLARQIAYEVTSKVEVGVDSPPFDGSRFGTVQHMTYAITLSDVDGRFKAYRHVQNVDITLYRNDPTLDTSWVVGFEGSNTPFYGAQVYMNLVSMQAGNRKVNIASKQKDYNAWLNMMYYNIKPLSFNPMQQGGEDRAPEPTHFIIHIDDKHEYRYPIENWNKDLTIDVDIPSGTTVFVKWIKIDAGGTELQLGISGLVAKKR